MNKSPKKKSPCKSPFKSPKRSPNKSPIKSPIRSPKRIEINLDIKDKELKSDKEDDLTIDNDTDESIIEIEDNEPVEENKVNENKKEIKQSIKRSIREKTRGKEINEKDKEKDNEEKKIENVMPLNILGGGISEHLMNHINKRMYNILSKLKMPLINIDDYTFNRKLGEGSYGIIYSVTSNIDNKKYAIKKIIARTLKEIDSFTKEFELVYSCNHPNIMKIYGISIRIF